MGIDLTRICNHNMHFSNEQEFVARVSQGFNCEVIPTCVGKEELTREKPFFYLEDSDGLSVQQYIDKKDLISMYKAKSHHDYFYINPSCIEISFEKYYTGRWHDAKWMTEHLNEHGFPDQAFYKDVSNKFWFINRKRYYDFIRTIGGTQSIIFCDDKHPDWLDYFAENYTLDDFIAWGKKDFIFVEFKDLVDFDFPDKPPDYYNVFILDQFEDLKSMSHLP